MHVADNGDVWCADGIDVPRMVTDGHDRFIRSLSKRELLHVRMLGTKQNAPLIVELYQKYCSPRKAGTLEVASPLICESVTEQHNPEVVLYRMRQCLLPASLGGWHAVGPVDYPSYALTAVILTERRNGYCEHHRQLLLTHPVWYDLLFIPTIDPESVIFLIMHIVDPRWFIDQQKPERLGKLKMSLGLTPAIMRQNARGNSGNTANMLCRMTLRCWKGAEPSVEDMERPGNFLWRRWRHAGGGYKGDLRASQDFVSYMVRTWQQQIVNAAGLSIDMFLPDSLLRTNEITAYEEHSARRPII